MSNSEDSTNTTVTEQAVSQSGSYDIIRSRLDKQASTLQTKIESLNEKRLKEFGESQMEILGRSRIRTSNNCVLRDIARVGDTLIFGYNVFIGLKKDVSISDVFSLYELQHQSSNFTIESIELKDSFLDNQRFIDDFQELYNYYKNTRLIQIRESTQYLLFVFQIGEKIDDIRVFRWSLQNNGDPKYVDNRGERDFHLPNSHDFEWIKTNRENFSDGKHPHINVLDQIFVETINGDLTIKIEDNTEDGWGIYREPVDDDHQSLNDANVYYSAIGSLILLKIKPYREDHWRYLVFNTLNHNVKRIDTIGCSCVQLPDDHGIIFPGGYYLKNGDSKFFEGNNQDLRFKRMSRSPNGEDVLYIFYEPNEGKFALFAYNMIRRELQNPLYGHGYSLFEDGRAILFESDNEKPTRVHPMQIWQTPFFSDEFASNTPNSQTFFGRIGNSDLVKGISDLLSLSRNIQHQDVTASRYEEIIASTKNLFDAYYWLEADEIGNISKDINTISETAELVLDEFEKVESIRQQANQALADTETTQHKLLDSITTDELRSPEAYAGALLQLRKQLGHLISIRELRYIDLEKLDTLEERIRTRQLDLNQETGEFLSQADALSSYFELIDDLDEKIESADSVATLTPLNEEMQTVSDGLDLLSELMGSLTLSDTTQRTQILESISSVYARLNQLQALVGHKHKSMRSHEAVAQFAAQFSLFGQSLNNALNDVNTPTSCDEQLSRLLIQLEEFESQFSEFDEFLSDIISKREEVYETFEVKKQQLLDKRQNRCHNLYEAAERILTSIQRRTQSYTDIDELNTFLASDTLPIKAISLCVQLKELDDTVRADDIESKLKSIKESAIRSLRDKSDLFERGGQIIRLGKHKFTVNTQETNLNLLVKDSAPTLHISGTDYYETVHDAILEQHRDLWSQHLVSENQSVYRSEYLAYLIIDAAQNNRNDLNWKTLCKLATDHESLFPVVRDFALSRYQEAYEKGIHDYDATRILLQLLPIINKAELLKYTPKSRMIASVFWAFSEEKELKLQWQQRASSAYLLKSKLQYNQAETELTDDLLSKITTFFVNECSPFDDHDHQMASNYLSEELAGTPLEFVSSTAAVKLVEKFLHHLEKINHKQEFNALLKQSNTQLKARLGICVSWLQGFVNFHQLKQSEGYVYEAAGILLTQHRLRHRVNPADLELNVEQLMGDHPLLVNRQLNCQLDDFLQRLDNHCHVVVKNYHLYMKARQGIIHSHRKQLKLEDFIARPLSSFVRNRLINQVYLPLIGDNLAKQMGSTGDQKRTDLMGLLLLISPPGYGKTTLMEYIANRLGLIFVKINAPALGHQGHSLDPANAPNATAAQELEKLNLALEMANNVMLYIDDIQHTHSEFLQKFISLCDGTRRIEGVWKNQAKTYDLRGKKFCIVMAGNPYTESGEHFNIPDMLSNRADIYNLGDILSGNNDVFELSYIENCLTSNPLLAPLALRDIGDVYTLIKITQGDELANKQLKHDYSGAEIRELTSVLNKLFHIQSIILKVNQQYIKSAAQDDRYRTEPPFKLQGSYRNMNSMAEKVVATMNDDELHDIVTDHYIGEAQTLTQGAEENLLKLAELRGTLSNTDKQRWLTIKQNFVRIQSLGGDDIDAASKISNQISLIAKHLESLSDTNEIPSKLSEDVNNMSQGIVKLHNAMMKSSPEINIINQPSPALEDILNGLLRTLDMGLMPVISAMQHKIRLDHDIWDKLIELGSYLKKLQKQQRNPISKKRIKTKKTKQTLES